MKIRDITIALITVAHLSCKSTKPAVVVLHPGYYKAITKKSYFTDSLQMYIRNDGTLTSSQYRKVQHMYGWWGWQEGRVIIVYDQKNGMSPKKNGNHRIFDVPSTGILYTTEKQQGQLEEYYFRKANGTLERIAESPYARKNVLPMGGAALQPDFDTIKVVTIVLADTVLAQGSFKTMSYEIGAE